MTPRRILVVDDNADAAQTLALLLELDGHRTRCAHDGWQALEQADAFDPDVVVLDIGLPGLDGNEVARRLRARSGGVPLLVALSGRGEEDDRARSAAAGFDDHFVKPLVTDDLLRRLETLLAARTS